MKYFNHLKEKWEIKSNLDIILILVVFALSGSAVLKVSGVIIDLFGLDELSRVYRWTLQILIITPIYQILLLIFAFILGQFNFFWQKEKKLFKLIGRLFHF
ncbi:MAG: diacylglyceryl transferase [Bacteroidetes bacterium]|nr:diacylglyceryl transferase [Bacteroidota bacterium]